VLDVGHVRAIFKVSEEFVTLAGTEPLVYIEWFTLLEIFDDTIGMYTVSLSIS
jgi:hypothetical protein